MGAGLPPFHLARALVERGNELVVDTVASKDEQILIKDRRAGRSLNDVVFKVSVFPNDLSRGVETNCAARSEVHVDALAIEHRRG